MQVSRFAFLVLFIASLLFMSSSSSRTSAYASASAAAQDQQAAERRVYASAFDDDGHSVAVVILGGSGFIGRELTRTWPVALSSLGVDLARVTGGVYAVNRGTHYWGSTPTAPPHYSPFVTHVIGDRGHTSKMQAAFTRIHALVGDSAENCRDRAKSDADSPARRGDGADDDAADGFASVLDLAKDASPPAAAAAKPAPEQQWIVVDFSAMEPIELLRVRNAIVAVNEDAKAAKKYGAVRVAHYVLVSTDSVYHDEKPTAAAAATGEDASDVILVTEQHPVRDIDPDASDDDYDQMKAQLELEAVKLFSKERTTMLRMADVIGPFDDTGRFWATLVWAELAVAFGDQAVITGTSMRLRPSTRRQMLSFTFSDDVVTLVKRIVTGLVAGLRSAYGSGKPLESGSVAISGPYNIACPDPIAMEDFVALLTQHAEGRKEALVKWLQERQARKSAGAPPPASSSSSDDDDSSSSSGSSSSSSSSDGGDATAEYYPSVSMGPISSERARKVLGFRGTSTADAVAATCKFFANLELRELDEFRKVVRKLPKSMRQFLC